MTASFTSRPLKTRTKDEDRVSIGFGLMKSVNSHLTTGTSFLPHSQIDKELPFSQPHHVHMIGCMRTSTDLQRMALLAIGDFMHVQQIIPFFTPRKEWNTLREKNNECLTQCIVRNTKPISLSLPELFTVALSTRRYCGRTK